jgi:hypothetical protein
MQVTTYFRTGPRRSPFPFRHSLLAVPGSPFARAGLKQHFLAKAGFSAGHESVPRKQRTPVRVFPLLGNETPSLSIYHVCTHDDSRGADQAGLAETEEYMV